jgi:caffeoyl-CoA O-methyltransferase
MFGRLSPAIQTRMRILEQIDARERASSTPQSRRLRQIGPETGRFLALMAAGAPHGGVIEIGTSAGYSTLWLALACLETHRTVTTFEVDEFKLALARETFRAAELEHTVTLVAGDARTKLHDMRDAGFCFLDAEKDIYAACYEAVLPAMVAGGILIADNAISHRSDLEDFLSAVAVDQRVDATVLPIGQGELVCRKR